MLYPQNVQMTSISWTGLSLIWNFLPKLFAFSIIAECSSTSQPFLSCLTKVDFASYRTCTNVNVLNGSTVSNTCQCRSALAPTKSEKYGNLSAIDGSRKWHSYNLTHSDLGPLAPLTFDPIVYPMSTITMGPQPSTSGTSTPSGN